MADEAAVVDEGISPAQSPLVTITFQRNIHRREKYLEAEPKALGITQIGLSVYMIVSLSVFLSNGLSDVDTDIPFFISSPLVVIAGSTAVAAQNLHLPTLRACLGMQIVACVACVVNIVCTLNKMADSTIFCWHDFELNTTYNFGDICYKTEVTLFAISATLAAYCCKVVNCCGPPAKMPVITVQAPPAQE